MLPQKRAASSISYQVRSAPGNAGSTDPTPRSQPVLPHGHFPTCPHSSDALHAARTALDWTLHAGRLSREQTWVAKLRAASHSLCFLPAYAAREDGKVTTALGR